jgi:phospholipase/carboxylesterase
MAAPHLIICLHGIGASGAQMRPIVDSWRGHLPDATFVTPDAPLKNSYGGNQWFKVDGMQLDPVRIREARDAFDTRIGNVIRHEGFDEKSGKIAFLGVSQGAIVALDAVASGRWKIGALVAFSGLLPLTTIPRSRNQIPILLIHGADDRTIPSMASTVAAEQLKTAGFQVEIDIDARVGHTISLNGAKKALQFLRRTLL